MSDVSDELSTPDEAPPFIPPNRRQPPRSVPSRASYQQRRTFMPPQSEDAEPVSEDHETTGLLTTGVSAFAGTATATANAFDASVRTESNGPLDPATSAGLAEVAPVAAMPLVEVVIDRLRRELDSHGDAITDELREMRAELVTLDASVSLTEAEEALATDFARGGRELCRRDQ